MNKQDFNNYKYRDIELIPTKQISFSHNLFFTGNLVSKKIKIDDHLIVISNNNNKAITFLKDFVKQTDNNYYTQGTFFQYTYSNRDKNYFIAEDTIRRFLTAVRIYKNTPCDSYYYFYINNKDYYHPMDISKYYLMKSNTDQSSTISLKKELNIIKKIHTNLGKASFNNINYYSKLSNAVQLFNHAYDTGWTLLKTTLLFSCLESLFSDSSKNEVTYKVALRTSYLLHPMDSKKRKDVFNFIKNGYDIRSYFVHGNDVEKRINTVMSKIGKDKKIENYSFSIDFESDLTSLVSQCLSNILQNNKLFTFFSNNKLDDKEISSFLDNLILDKYTF